MMMSEKVSGLLMAALPQMKIDGTVLGRQHQRQSMSDVATQKMQSVQKPKTFTVIALFSARTPQAEPKIQKAITSRHVTN